MARNAVDELDVRLLILLREQPRLGVLEASRVLRVARGTVQARLERLTSSGVVSSLGPVVDPAALGWPVLAFVQLEIAQGRLAEAVADVARIPEVLEAHGTTGASDLLLRVCARDTEHLQVVLGQVLASGEIRRSSTQIALTTPLKLRTEPLEKAAASLSV